MTTTTPTHERNWTTVGAERVDQIGRDRIEAEIERLDWQPIPKDGALSVAYIPGFAINATIHDLRLPKVSAAAISSFDVPPERPGEDGSYPGFYGIECRYTNGRARVYVLDFGGELLPVCSDFWKDWPEETADTV